MSIMAKSATGENVEVASKGVATGGLITGIIGASLGALNSGLLGGAGGGLLGGNGAVTTNSVAAGAETLANIRSLGECCFVNKDVFWSNLLNQANVNAERDIAIERRFASVESALATNAAVGECNKAAIAREFDVVNQRFVDEARYDDLALRYALSQATCGMIKGTTVVTPSQIGSTYVNPVNVLDQHEARIYDRGRGHGGWDDGCSPCGGYRGF